MRNILFVCVDNAGRSQMAEAFAKKYGKSKMETQSVGSMPADRVNPTVAKVIAELEPALNPNQPNTNSHAPITDKGRLWPKNGRTSFFLPRNLQVLGSRIFAAINAIVPPKRWKHS